VERALVQRRATADGAMTRAMEGAVMSSWFSDPDAGSNWLEDVDGSESYPIVPVCIAIDTSGSMAQNGALVAVNQCLPELASFLRDEPVAAEMARIGIITFDSTAREALGLSDLAEVAMPTLSAQGATSFSCAFREVKRFFESYIPRLGRGAQYYAPIVFLITDGQPTDAESVWRPTLDELKRKGKYRCNVVCFGFGDADAEILRTIGMTFIARDQDPVAATRAVFRELMGSIKTTSASVRDAVESGGSGRLEFSPDVTSLFVPYIPLDLNQNA
jgi:uncharacterized protein YegL